MTCMVAPWPQLNCRSDNNKHIFGLQRVVFFVTRENFRAGTKKSLCRFPELTTISNKKLVALTCFSIFIPYIECCFSVLNNIIYTLFLFVHFSFCSQFTHCPTLLLTFLYIFNNRHLRVRQVTMSRRRPTSYVFRTLPSPVCLNQPVSWNKMAE